MNILAQFGSFPEKVGELSTNIVFSGKLLFFPVEIQK